MDIVATGFIDQHPKSEKVSESVLRYLANLAGNGHLTKLGSNETKLKPGHSKNLALKVPEVDTSASTDGLCKILLGKGPERFA